MLVTAQGINKLVWIGPGLFAEASVFGYLSLCPGDVTAAMVGSNPTAEKRAGSTPVLGTSLDKDRYDKSMWRLRYIS